MQFVFAVILSGLHLGFKFYGFLYATDADDHGGRNYGTHGKYKWWFGVANFSVVGRIFD